MVKNEIRWSDNWIVFCCFFFRLFVHVYVTGPSVQLSTNSVNFMQINVGEVATRTVDVINNSDMEAAVQVGVHWDYKGK